MYEYGPLIYSLVNFAYATMGLPEPDGTKPVPELLDELKEFADSVRWQRGFLEKESHMDTYHAIDPY